MATDAAKSTSVESIEKGAISLSPIRRNSVLEEFRASRFADIQEEICSVVSYAGLKNCQVKNEEELSVISIKMVIYRKR